MERVNSLNSEIIPKGSIVERICRFLRARHVEFYLVGGYVRDQLRGRPSHDADFVVAGEALRLARKVADRFGGHFFPLDKERDTGRAILRDEEGEPFFVDFARLRGEDIVADLALRDFTIDAIALDLSDPVGPRLIDPYDGCDDLQAGLVRAVSEEAFRDDPLRTLRAVRLAAELGMSIEPHTEALLREAAPLINRVSAERVRDELSKIVTQPGAADHLRYLDELGLLPFLIPEVEPMKGLEQPSPHHLDVFEHSLETVRWLEALVDTLQGKSKEAKGALALVPERLGPFAPRLTAHLARPASGGRTRLTMLKLAAFLHDVGKPATRSLDEEGRIHFFGHEGKGAAMAAAILRRLRFSAGEVRLVRTIIAHHMRPMQMARQEAITKRATYRFFRDMGEAGVDTLLVCLADHLATWGPHLRASRWERRVELVASLLEDYYLRRREVISPPKLLNGRDLMRELGLEEGPRIGQLLEAVREAQVEGKVRTREEALASARAVLQGGLK